MATKAKPGLFSAASLQVLLDEAERGRTSTQAELDGLKGEPLAVGPVDEMVNAARLRATRISLLVDTAEALAQVVARLREEHTRAKKTEDEAAERTRRQQAEAESQKRISGLIAQFQAATDPLTKSQVLSQLAQAEREGV